MDARGVQRLLEKLQGLAESAEHLGIRNIEMLEHETGLSEDAKHQLAMLHREQSLRLLYLYSSLGEQACDVLRDEATDNTARGLIDLFHANFAVLKGRARDLLSQDIGDAAKLS